MVRRLLFLALGFGLLLGSTASQAFAQAAAGTTRCGGLLCDMYYAGKPAPVAGQPEPPDPTHLPCRDFLCAAFGGRTSEPAPPVAAEPIAAPVAAETRKVAKGKKTKANSAVATAGAPPSER